MPIKREYIIAARDQFRAAQQALVMAVRALQESGLPSEQTQKEAKETIGDLACTVEVLNDALG